MLRALHFRDALRAMKDKDNEKVAILEVTQKCNQNCIFCLDQAKKGAKDVPIEDVVSQIECAARSGANKVIFMTGEPLLRKDIGQILDFLKRKNLQVCITTNGTLLAKRERLDFLLEHSVFQYNISVHTCRKDVASAISSKPWTFERQAQALKNLNEAAKSFPYLRIYTKTVVNALNYDHMVETAQYLKEALKDVQILQLGFKMMRAVNPAQSRLLVPLSILKPYLEGLGKAMSSEAWLVFDGFPLCALGDFAFLAREIEDVLRVRTYQRVPDNVPMREQVADGYVKSEECEVCSLNAFCFGAHHESVQYLPKPWFFPVNTSPEILLNTAVERLPYQCSPDEIIELVSFVSAICHSEVGGSAKTSLPVSPPPIISRLKLLMMKVKQIGGERVNHVTLHGDCLRIAFSDFVVWVKPNRPGDASLFSTKDVAVGYSGNESQKAVAVTKKVFRIISFLASENL